MKALIIASVFLLQSTFLFSQAGFNGWYASFNTLQLKNNFSLQSDIQFRSTDQLKHMNTYLLRAGLNYSFDQHIMVTAGYAHIFGRRSIGEVTGYIGEHRIWQQLLITHKIGNLVPVQHRFRLEQRFLGNPVVENNQIKTEDYSFSNRARYFTRGIIPLNGKKQFSRGVFSALQNEIFLHFGDKSAVNGKTFDQNRLYLASGYRFNSKFDTEIGYMNQYIAGRADRFSNNHILQVATYLRL
ncbi:MAG: DUF2490 domain-containing protein [Chitinophagaceae bacterium]|nr:DUF2490 domain-containing protein [Chitinophagaceae bacterium]MCW5927718.1 DUF2490 domain-containing protein [Chitinophagaceae bacterium]